MRKWATLQTAKFMNDNTARMLQVPEPDTHTSPIPQLVTT
jgi:hypothetical protein